MYSGCSSLNHVYHLALNENINIQKWSKESKIFENVARIA